MSILARLNIILLNLLILCTANNIESIYYTIYTIDNRRTQRLAGL